MLMNKKEHFFKMAHCINEEYKWSIQPVEVDVKRHQISVQLSTTVKRTKKGSRVIKDGKGYKRIISGTKILVEKKPHYKKPSWNPPRAKELRVSDDGENWFEPTSEDYKELTGLYVEYWGHNNKWNRFIENGELVKRDKVEYAFVDAIDTIDTKQMH